MERARQAEAEIAAGRRRGPLHGIPIALKDLYDTAGIPTTGGSKILAENVPDEDCPAAAKLGEAGAVLLGKLNMHEFAFGITNVNPHYGPARNPWNTDCITGGSSGGSATATAASLCAASLGSDTGGSIRIPAAFCGIVGLKPTYGRVSKRGVLPLSTSLDTAGPMTRTVADAAIVLQAIAGHDPLDPNSVDAPVPNYLVDMSADIRGLRIGVVRGDYRLPMDDELEGAVEAAVSALGGLGATLVDPLELPLLREALPHNFVIISSEAAAYHAKYLDERPGDYGEDVYGRLSGGRNNAATDYIIAREDTGQAARPVVGSDGGLRCAGAANVAVGGAAHRAGPGDRRRGRDGPADCRDLVYAAVQYHGVSRHLRAMRIHLGRLAHRLPVGGQTLR